MRRVVIVRVTALMPLLLILCISSPGAISHEGKHTVSTRCARAKSGSLALRAQNQKLSLHVEVREPDGTGVPNATVTASFTLGASYQQSATTDAQGRALLQINKPTLRSASQEVQLLITVVKPDFYDGEDSVSYTGNIPDQAIRTVTLKRTTTQKVNLKVTVRDSFGNAIGNARVNVWHNRAGALSGTPDYALDTNPDGIAVIPVDTTRNFFTSKPELSLIIRVVKTDFEPSQDQVDISQNAPSEVTRTITLRMNGIGRGDMQMQVKVVTEDDKPVGNAQVYVAETGSVYTPPARGFAGQTDANGNARITVSRHGSFEIRVNLQGFPETTLPVKIDGDPLPATAGPFTVKLPKPNGTLVTINVTDVDNNQPVVGAAVALKGDTRESETTDAAGNVVFVIPQPGTYAVDISQDTYQPLRNSEINVEPNQEKRVFPFVLKSKPNQDPNSIDISVMDAANSDLAATNLPIAEAKVTITYPGGQITGPTNSSGRVRFTGSFVGAVQVAVEASGYTRQVRTVNVKDTPLASGSHPSVSFLMQAENTQDTVTVTVVTASTDDPSAQMAPVEGATVTVGGLTTTTDSSGKAVLTGFFDGQSMRVQKIGFKPQSQQVPASKNQFSPAKGSLTFVLQPVATEDSIDVTVIGLTAAGASPIDGATVSAGSVTAKTDSSGHAKLTGKIGQTAQVTASANGFGTKSASVTLAQPERATSVTISLPANLRLVIEVREAANPDKTIADANVYLRMKDSDATIAGPRSTNGQGNAYISLTDTPDMPLDRIRAGLRLSANKQNYQTKESAITPDLLQPSTEPRRVTIFLDRDWSELANAIAALESRVNAWANDFGQSSETATNARMKLFIDKAVAARTRSEELLNELKAGRDAFGRPAGAPGSFCIEAALIKQNILNWKELAEQKAKDINRILDEGKNAVAKCSTAADAEVIRSKYRTAIKTLADIGSLNKLAVYDRDDLLKLAEKSLAMKDLMKEFQGKVAEVKNQLNEAQEAESKAADDIQRMRAVRRSLEARQAGLQGEVNALSNKHAGDFSGLQDDQLKLLKQRLDAMQQRLFTNDVASYPGNEAQNQVVPQPITDAIKAINEIDRQAADEAEKSQGAICDIDTMDHAVDGIQTTLDNASFEIGLAADLPKQADDCARSAGTTTADAPAVESIPEDKPAAPASGNNSPQANAAGVVTAGGATVPPAVESIPEDKPGANNKPSGRSSNPPPVVESIPEDKTPRGQPPTKANQPSTVEPVPEGNSQTTSSDLPGKQSGSKKEKPPRDPNKPSTAEKIGTILGGIVSGLPRQPTDQGGGSGGSSGGTGNSGGRQSGGGPSPPSRPPASNGGNADQRPLCDRLPPELKAQFTAPGATLKDSSDGSYGGPSCVGDSNRSQTNYLYFTIYRPTKFTPQGLMDIAAQVSPGGAPLAGVGDSSYEVVNKGAVTGDDFMIDFTRGPYQVFVKGLPDFRDRVRQLARQLDAAIKNWK